MKIEKPCSPGHCLKILNGNMRTDILRSVHQRIQARMDQRDKKSPLEIFIESIEEVIESFEGIDLYECFGRNPFNIDPGYRFNPKPDYNQDIKLLKSQLGSLREIFASLDKLN
jgi:hypothetical protein